MTQLIAHPFRLGVDSSVKTNLDGTTAQIGEQLALLVLTRPGERIIVPGYGLNDPAFGRFDAAALATQLEMYGPDVQIDEVLSEFTSESTEDVLITYT